MLLQIKTLSVEEGGVGIRIFIFLSGKLLHLFLGLCDYSDKFVLQFLRNGMPFNRKFLSSMWSELNLNQVSNKAASSVDKEKLLRSISIGDILTHKGLR